MGKADWDFCPHSVYSTSYLSLLSLTETVNNVWHIGYTAKLFTQTLKRFKNCNIACRIPAVGSYKCGVQALSVHEHTLLCCLCFVGKTVCEYITNACAYTGEDQYDTHSIFKVACLLGTVLLHVLINSRLLSRTGRWRQRAEQQTAVRLSAGTKMFLRCPEEEILGRRHKPPQQVIKSFWTPCTYTYLQQMAISRQAHPIITWRHIAYYVTLRIVLGKLTVNKVS